LIIHIKLTNRRKAEASAAAQTVLSPLFGSDDVHVSALMFRLATRVVTEMTDETEGRKFICAAISNNIEQSKNALK